MSIKSAFLLILSSRDIRIRYAALRKNVIRAEITVLARIRKVLYVSTYICTPLQRPAHLAPFGSTGIISEGNYRSLRSPIIIIVLIFRVSLAYPILFSTLRIIPSSSRRRTLAFTRSALRIESSFVPFGISSSFSRLSDHRNRMK